MGSSFPKPEKGVPRYEMRIWYFESLLDHPDGPREWIDWEGFSRKARARRVLAQWDRTPAYIYDRKTGEVIATNQEALEARDGSDGE